MTKLSSLATTQEIRSAFLDYFGKRGHQIVPSASLVPQNDPSLLFTNAGMVPFKNIFMGEETRAYQRAVSAQKVVRAGGKHNDLDNVGYTARHLTFFEMLGNFSFGDYFKAEAIEFAWTLLTQVFCLPKEKLLVTVYAQDDEAANLWKRIAQLPEEKIIRIATSDNFWRMGDTGPCGPCSEIFYDHGPGVAGGVPGSADEDGDRYVEIWNLVFMQFMETKANERVSLPRPSIDTGMGLERFAAVMQGKHNVYETDVLRNLVLKVGDITRTNPDGPQSASHRVVADHLRSSAFLISDGVLPLNEGRGYVLRRIMRRAMRHLQRLGAREPIFYQLLPELLTLMGGAYPELTQRHEHIAETMRSEEERFVTLLGRGTALLEEEIAKLGAADALSGDVAFKLYDTYGFPLDLTQDALRDRGRTVDVAGFEALMQAQRARARAAWVGSGDQATDRIWFEGLQEFGPTAFQGYHHTSTQAQVKMLVQDAKRVESVAAGEEAIVILDCTPFYAESGGQVGDQGTLIAASLRANVLDTQKRATDLYAHLVRVEEGLIRVGMSLEAQVEVPRRGAIATHHTATHLLHAALRKRLGAHVTQKGSLNSADRLRFDVSHPHAISQEDLRDVERDVNRQIRANLPVTTDIMKATDAVSSGAMALFGEKYGDDVRVVSIGEQTQAAPFYSRELCGGTHVRRTGDIGTLHIIGESGIASGVRRIEAVCGEAAEDFVSELRNVVHQGAEALKASQSDLVDRIKLLVDERRALERRMSELQRHLAIQSAKDACETIGALTFLPYVMTNVAIKDLKSIAEALAKLLSQGIVTLLLEEAGKASVVIAVTPDLSKTLSAVDLVRRASHIMGGAGGGGRANLAQAGGTHLNAQAVFDDLRHVIREFRTS